MKDDSSSYRSILKAISLFGGVQIFNILIAVVKSKLVAILIGPTGMGIYGLLTSTTQLISNSTNFGLQTSSVRNISESVEKNDSKGISLTISVLNNLLWITGFFGLIITLVLSPYLSFVCFKNYGYTLSFIFLSATILFTQLNGGQNSILQGTRNWKFLAKSNLYGSFFGLLFSLPFYYYFRLEGIVPAIVIASIFSLIFSWVYSRRIDYEQLRLKFRDVFTHGKSMIILGLALSSSGLITLLVSYIIRIFIGRCGSLADVGLYNAGFTIINTYVGMVLTAMSTDYFPRLAGVSSDNEKCSELINKQTQVVLLLLTPLLLFFFLFSGFILQLLYSDKFLPVSNMVKWAAFGMFFRALSWCVSFVFPAKGESKLFFINELVSNAFNLLFSLSGYYLYGLNGLGYAFLATYVVYTIQCFFVSRYKYGFGYEKRIIKQVAFQFIMLFVCFLLCLGSAEYRLLFILIQLILFAFSILYSFLKLKYLIVIRKDGFKKAECKETE